MAFLLPTIATKRANRSVARNLAGASAIFIARTRFTSLRLVTIARRVAAFLPHGRGAAARSRRSLMASPRPARGTGITAIVAAPDASSTRRWENRLAAASMRSPRRDRRPPLASGRRRAAPRAPPRAGHQAAAAPAGRSGRGARRERSERRRYSLTRQEAAPRPAQPPARCPRAARRRAAAAPGDRGRQ